MIARRLFLTALMLGLSAPKALRSDEGAYIPPADRTRFVAFAQDTMHNDWRIAQVRNVERALRHYRNVRFVYSDAGGQVSRQILDIEGFAARGVDVLITSPLDATVMAPVVAAVHAAGIPVVLLSRRVNGDAFTCFVHASNRTIGRDAARFLSQRLGGRGRILVLQHIPTTTPAIERTEGFLEELANHPGLAVAAIRRADSLRSKAILAVEEVLAEGVPFDAIYAQSDGMASGARFALRRAGIDPASVPTVGVDYIAEARDAILAGEQAGSFLYPTFGAEGADLAVRLMRGETVPKEIVVDTRLITAAEAASIQPIF
ncbi:substrate-binding domain-containing protein [Azospirillum halopraeferens]|uniref:substrate-binding domain-containing protein n=1 Tax=Azospirillum halopraeferens TaxID=34010 RepID=UPI00042630A1|nr:substrate-binding domain-containing protein [Azospirillum halopraeferens]